MEKHTIQFLQLITSMENTAYTLLGEVKNPFTGEEEKDLNAALATIATLEMLQAKTKGNLSEEEVRVLKSMIKNLKGHYKQAISE